LPKKIMPVWSPTLLGLDLPLTTLIGITEKRKQQQQSLSDYTQQDLSMVTKRSPLDMQWL
jgi:hypothetical protein